MNVRIMKEHTAETLAYTHAQRAIIYETVFYIYIFLFLLQRKLRSDNLCRMCTIILTAFFYVFVGSQFNFYKFSIHTRFSNYRKLSDE